VQSRVRTCLENKFAMIRWPTIRAVACTHLGCDDRTFPHFATGQLLDRNRGIRGRFLGDPICPAEPSRMLTSSSRL
jgi:hypothetical protein